MIILDNLGDGSVNQLKGLESKTKSTATSYLRVKEKRLLLKSRNKTGYLVSPLLFSILIELLARAIRQKRK